MGGPLEGIRVIDCTIWLQGPEAAAVLGGLGADVIKVEERSKGDPMRGLMSAYYQSGGRNRQFEAVNLSKRGIALDLRKQEGREVVYRLVEEADVFMTNMRSGAAERLGLGYDILSGLNPRLVYALASGWGTKGPEKERGAFDIAVAARTGLMYISGEPQVPPVPQRPPGGICDVGGALCLALGILAALQARDRLGKGQMVETSLFGSTITLAKSAVSFALNYGVEQEWRPRSEVRNPLFGFYECADGEWIYLAMLQFDKYWPIFCEVMGIEELEKDPRFQDLGAITEHSSELIPILDNVFATRTRAEWMMIFTERDFIFAPIQKATQLANDPQAIANDYIIDFDHPAYGSEKVIGLPYKFSDTPASIECPAPELGQHAEEILLELGYGLGDITRLRDKEVI